ncbi:C-type lectin domain family 9 member A [Ornithorhynchus anatinus]|uniref:C-type lectin domain family 9 member A n=1 Tax=Ornithorhynchus anatinus TaxID=9258 RepID=UPI0019D49BDB|nr:C-type lectin domain family 9 member A [Ornithorhynchus anatinus]
MANLHLRTIARMSVEDVYILKELAIILPATPPLRPFADSAILPEPPASLIVPDLHLGRQCGYLEAMQDQGTYDSLYWVTPDPPPVTRPSLKTGTWWRLLTVMSWLFCLPLLASTVILSLKVIQASELIGKQEEILANLSLQQRVCSERLQVCQVQIQMSTSPESNCSLCLEPWVMNGESCYLFFDGWKNWASSSEFCVQEKSELLKIGSKEELAFINRNIERKKTGSSWSYWVGLTQDKCYGDWRWRDSTVPSSDLWPNQHSWSAGEACGHLTRGALSSASCSKWKYFICEKCASSARGLPAGLTP